MNKDRPCPDTTHKWERHVKYSNNFFISESKDHYYKNELLFIVLFIYNIKENKVRIICQDERSKEDLDYMISKQL